MSSRKTLAKDCSFTAAVANEYREEMIRDLFINSLASPSIRQRLLEDDYLTLTRAAELADTLDRFCRQSNCIESPSTTHLKTITEMISSDTRFNMPLQQNLQNPTNCKTVAVGNSMLKRKDTSQTEKCYFCGKLRHASREVCPEKNALCLECGKKKVHFAKMFRSRLTISANALVGMQFS